MIKEMQESGLVEFGSHTMNHPNLEKIPLDDAEWEVRESKKQLEDKLKTEICAFAYPYGAGAYNPEVRKKVLESGYIFDFSFRQGKTQWPWQREKDPIERLFIKGDENNFDLYLHLTRGFARLI
jgi:peptidoglycan/xylan/chitin deacetylase (PgdA/CDA1 family)